MCLVTCEPAGVVFAVTQLEPSIVGSVGNHCLVWDHLFPFANCAAVAQVVDMETLQRCHSKAQFQAEAMG